MENFDLSFDTIDLFKKRKTIPIQTMFKLPSPLPIWPQGEGFATGRINLGGLEVCQISTFNKIWATHEGGPDNLGATFFEPSQLPNGFFMLGCYSQPNNKPLFGWVLAGKDDGNDPTGSLAKPVDYQLLWSSESMKIKQDGNGYIWLPIPPAGYNALGHVVANTPGKPPLEKIRCVRSDLTDKSENDASIWGHDAISVYDLRPSFRGTQELGVCVGTFIAQVNGVASSTTLYCLKNKASNFSSMPNLSQIQALVQAYSPWVYLHPDEQFLPSSVSWFFSNGALLYQQGHESSPVSIDPSGSNLPQGGSNDGTYWLDLPVDEAAKENVKKGNLQSAGAYFHVKGMFGGSCTDLAIWVFYPFNGAARAKVSFINHVYLGKIGEHVGDWEHVTLRISNFSGELWKIFVSEHSGGTWVDASQLEFQSGNKVVTYASLHGHAFYSKPGLVLQGNTDLGIGIRNDTSKSKIFMDTGVGYEIVSVDYSGSKSVVVEPPWLKFAGKWGPKLSYDLAAELHKVEKLLPGKLKSAFEGVINRLPKEILGEEGPNGPKMKNNWRGDEI